MAHYTTELRSICETYAGYDEEQGYGNVDEVISKALPKLFDFDFPIYDESYRSVLETKIVRHFYTREIGAETVGRWKLFLQERLNLIMPYYNQRYKSTLLDFNPFYDVDLTTDHSKDNNGNNKRTSDNVTTQDNNRRYQREDEYKRSFNEVTNNERNLHELNKYDRSLTESNKYERNLDESSHDSRNLTDNSTTTDNKNDWDEYSDTPQGGLTGIEQHNYLTNARHLTNADTSTTNETQGGTTSSETAQTGTTTNNVSQGGSASNNITQTGNTENNVVQSGGDNRNIRDTDVTNNTTNFKANDNHTYADTESYLEHVKGKSPGKSMSELLNEYRDTFINIDNEIIGNLNDLFLNLW